MIRKIGLSMLCAAGLFSTDLFSATEYTWNQAAMAPIEVVLQPNEPQPITNSFFWTIEGVCTIVSDVESTPISVSILRKSGSLNGVPLSKGEKIDLIVHPDEKLYFSAASGGRVELVNHGEQMIKALCSSV